MAGTLVVRRDSDGDIKIRGMDVLVDGEWKTDLHYGHSYEIELPVGEHTLAVSNKLKKSEEQFILSEGEKAVFQATNVMSKGVSVVLMGLGMVMYNSTLRRVQ
jgi:uncharacterized protein YgfB (UPF0149 family)